jgi:hypothetical protein
LGVVPQGTAEKKGERRAMKKVMFKSIIIHDIDLSLNASS